MLLIHHEGGTHGAAENMALDLLLLEAHPEPDAMRFRHYGWTRPSITFGYSQQVEWIRGQAPSSVAVGDIIRRPTGGGLVDHRNDWTYAFVIPARHPHYRTKAEDVYWMVHQSLADAFSQCGIEATTAPEKPVVPAGAARLQGLCFAAPEVHDVIVAKNGRKVAGAAMKRNRHGLLLQGSADRTMVGAEFDWAAFYTQAIRALCLRFGGTRIEEAPAPDYPAQILAQEVERFSSTVWNDRR